jgi:hypothetical protein
MAIVSAVITADTFLQQAESDALWAGCSGLQASCACTAVLVLKQPKRFFAFFVLQGVHPLLAYFTCSI